MFNGDHLRGMQSKRDGWEQVTSHLNRNVNQLWMNVDSEEKELLWQEKSQQDIYDEIGLKIASIDSLQRKTLYFYDQDERLVLQIDPAGRMTQWTLNNFGGQEVVRHYIQMMDVTTLAQLSGGFFTDEIAALLKPDNSKDVIQRMNYDHEEQVVKVISPFNAVSTKSYNAFSECEQEQTPVDEHTVMITKREYEARGLITQTTKTSGHLVITTSSVYDNPYEKMTQHNNGKKELMEHDVMQYQSSQQILDINALKKMSLFSEKNSDKDLTHLTKEIKHV